MPWTGKSFQQKHNHKLNLPQAKTGARVANAILRETGDEGKAIKIGNYVANKHHDPMSAGFNKEEWPK